MARWRFPLYWWEVLALSIVLAFSGVVWYLVASWGKAKKQIFQPRVSTITYPEASFSVSSPPQTSQYRTFLFLGMGGAGHPGGALTDSIQVVILNPETKAVSLISVPRDLYLKVNGCGYHKINTMYWCGERLGEGGGEFAKKLVGEILGLRIDYYVKMDFSGFRDLVDLLGGVDVYVEKNFSDRVVGLYLTKGWHHLDGETALRYVRTRYTDSDFDRSRRQQQVILALKKKLLSAGFYLNPYKIYRFIKILSSHLRTDIPYEETLRYLRELDEFEVKKTYVIDNRKDNLLYASWRGGAYVLLPVGGDFSRIQAKVKELLP